MTQDTNSKRFEEVPCPFCSLLCDDLIISQLKDGLKVNQNGCKLAKTRFEANQLRVSPAIAGKACSLEDAVKKAVKILKHSNQALIGGLGTDVNGMRAALRLTEKAGAVIDHMHSNAAFRNLDVLQNHGYVMTTLAEIRNRADLIIFAGTDANTNFPRFFERIINPSHSLVKIDKKDRQLVYIGDKLDSSPASKSPGKRPIKLQCGQDDIGEVFSILHALSVGLEIDKPTIGNIKLSQLKNLKELLLKASYGVIVWAPGELDFPYAELTVQTITEIIKYLNRMTRFAGFSLGGSEGGMTATQVTAWQSGYPSRVSYARGFPDFDAYRFSGRRLLETNELDALFWISSLGAPIDLPDRRVPSIVLAAPSVKINGKPDVYIPVGVPGVNHTGQMIRTDGVVSFKLKKLQNSEHPGVADVINRITEAYR